MKNEVQLITYANRFGGETLEDLRHLLTRHFRGVFGGVHLLPFFLPIDGADAGFDPVDHTAVDPQVGDWSAVRALGADFDLTADLIVNHMSSQAGPFRDYLSKGESSAFNGLFLTKDMIFPHGASADSLKKIYRPRPGMPFTPMTFGDGSRKDLWTTFTPEQIDINVVHPQGQRYLRAILERFAASGVQMVRLDAVGYAIKRADTTCFMIPETFEFIAALTEDARALGVEVLVEVHSHYLRQIEIAKHVDRVYDFALPPLVLHAFAFKTGTYLKRWIDIRPSNALTVLDTHDGIGIVDIGADPVDPLARPGLVPPEDLAQLVEVIHRNSGGQSRQATGAAASNLDSYQVNCTFFDAMGRSEHEYLLARAIQFFLPGIPQVYYVGLLAGGNDMDLLARTGVGRDINRHYFDEAEVLEALRRPVVRDLMALASLRNTHPAFAGEFACELTGGGELRLSWSRRDDHATLCVDFARGEGELELSAFVVDGQPRPVTRRAFRSSHPTP